MNASLSTSMYVNVIFLLTQNLALFGICNLDINEPLPSLKNEFGSKMTYWDQILEALPKLFFLF